MPAVGYNFSRILVFCEAFVKNITKGHMSSMDKQATINPKLAIPLGILAVSTSSIFIRYAQESASSVVIAAYRLSIATIILLPIAIWKYKDELKAVRRKELGLAAISGFFLALHFATWITSLEFTTVASSVVLVSTSPLWVALISKYTLKESLQRNVLVGLVIALAGSAVVGIADSCISVGGALQCPPLSEFIQGDAFYGDLLALAGAIAAAGYLLIGRNLRANMSLIPYVFLVYGFSAIVLIAIAFQSGQAAFGYPDSFYWWVFLVAVIPQLLGHSTFNWALRHLPATYVSITLLGEPIGSTILAILLLSEVPSPAKLFGAILILAGIILASRQNKNT
ncbi:MAG: DMT family transporter [Chloroflexota bacterium]